MFLGLITSLLSPQFAEVSDGGDLPCSAFLSPLSALTALLTVFRPSVASGYHTLTLDAIAPAAADTSSDLPEVVSSVLGGFYDIMEGDGGYDWLGFLCLYYPP